MTRHFHVCYRENGKLEKIKCDDYRQAERKYDELDKQGKESLFIWET